MPKIDVHTKFTFTRSDAQRVDYCVGEHHVDEVTANHVYVKYHSTLVNEVVIADDAEQEVEAKSVAKKKKAAE